jgi:Nuclease-related domain
VALSGVGVAATVYDQLWFGRVGFVSGAAWGGAFSVWIALRNSPPSFIENWQRGAWGEEFTADELAKLPKAEWEPVHDLPDRGGNIDHVVLGPSGIFLLDSKKYSGIIQVVGDDLVMTNEMDASRCYTDRRLLVRMRSQAARLNGELKKRTGRSPWVEPVVVVWGTFPSRIHQGNGVTVVHGLELVGWLNARPHKGANAREFAEHIRGGRHRRGV